MTSQKDQIQALITDIDGVLQKTTPRLPWVVSGEITQQRQVLERVRNYLVSFQRRQTGEGYGQAGARPDLLAHDIYYQPSQPPYPSSQGGAQSEQQGYGQDELNAQQMLQTIVQEMGYLRANLMQPLQSDLEGLRQQREALVYEIRQLEAQRQGYAGQLHGNQQQLIAEFLQALMSRLQETLPQQLAQTLRDSNQPPLPYANPLALAGSAPLVTATSDAPSQGLGNIQVAQSQSDEMLIRLDSTLSVVFESLQRNVQAYQESLSQGLDKMHQMGQQGEMMFTALISHLAQQLGREASSYLQPPASAGLEATRSPTPSPPSPPQSAQPSSLKATVNPTLFNQPGIDTASSLPLPFPGTEMSGTFTDAAAAPVANVPLPSVDTAIESWLRSAGNVDATPDVDLEIAELNLEGFDLSQLAAQDVNALLELDANLLGTNLPPQPILAPIEPLTVPPSQETDDAPIAGAMTAEDTADIDAALKLLEQLSSELDEQPSSVADAEAQIDRMLSNPSSLQGEASATVSIPDDARDELDEFYESLFGSNAIAAEPTAEALPPVDTTAQASSQAITELEQAVAPLDLQPTSEPQLTSDPQPLSSLSSQPSAVEPVAIKPVDSLPAETQPPTGASATSSVAEPVASTVVDPTLGWDLLAKPLAASTAEPEIPAALLEDELLDGWDLADAEVDLFESAEAPDDEALLSGWEPLSEPDTATGDRTPLAPDTAAIPSPVLDLETPASDIEAVTVPASASTQDEITTLTDLFDETTPAETLSLESVTAEEATIADSPIAAEMPTQPPVNVLASPTKEAVPPAFAEDLLVSDLYTPASPEEDLLPLDATVDEPDTELWLDESTLSRLSEDLFSLEEAIAEPVVLPYGAEPEAEAPAFSLEAPAPYETTLPLSEPTTLADWSNASLNEFAEALPASNPAPFPLESESSAIAAEPPGAFTLEGMDDLFANTPVTPPVTPISPPVSPIPSETAAPFTLEGMDDLFDESLPSAAPPSFVPTASPDQPPPFNLEGMDDLFDESLPSAAPPSFVPTASPDQPPLFTLEGMDDLFTDSPAVSTAPLPEVSEVTQALPDQPLPFTLEGMDDLFTDASPMSHEAATSTSSASDSSASDVPLVVGTLPVADGFAVEPEALTAAQQPSQPDQVSDFTLEQVGNLFIEVPSAGLPVSDEMPLTTIAPTLEALPEPASAPVAPFTLEQVGGLFMEVPLAEAPSTEAPSTEAPSTESPTLNEPAPAVLPTPIELPSEASPPPFTFDQMDTFFVETPASEVPPITPQPSSPPAASEPSTLEQAFASLMGAFDEPAAGTEATNLDPEKKKDLS